MAKPNGKAPADKTDVMERLPRIDISAVRFAGPADETEIYRLLLLAHAEISLFPHSNERVIWYVKRFLNGRQLPLNDTGPRGVFGVIGSVGALVAVTMVGLGQYWYTDQRHLEEYLVFVDPEHRNDPARYGQMLVEWLKQQSEETGLPLLTGILSNHRTQAKCRLYQRMLPKVGEYFFYNPLFKEVPVFNADTVTGPGTMVRSSSLAL